MKKIVTTLAAALCCAMTTSGFIACVSHYEPPLPQIPIVPEEPAEEPEEKTPATVRVQFSVENRDDMLKYLDIVVKCNNGERVFSSNVLTEEHVEGTDDTYFFWTNMFVSKLPAEFKIWREVSVKDAFRDSVNTLQTFDYSNYIDFHYTLYNDNNQAIGQTSGGHFDFIKGLASNPEEVQDVLANLDSIFGEVYELNFDEKGNRVGDGEVE